MSAIAIDRLNRVATQAPASRSLSVVIPAYNEERAIAVILERVRAVKSALQAVGIENLEVIVVDDGSHDHTVDVVTKYPDVRLVRHPKNRGYGAALKTGFSNATCDLLAFLDADGTYPPEYLPELCRFAMNNSDLVRPMRVRRARCITRDGIFLVTMHTWRPHHVSDSASGMRVFRRDVLNRMYPLPDGLNFTPVMSTRAIHEGLTITEVPIPYSERVGASKLSVVRDGMRFLNSIIWTALSYNPVRILGLLGSVGLLIAALIGLTLVVLRINGVAHLGETGVFAVYAGLVLSVTGVSLLTLGAMFNYLVSLLQHRQIQQGLFGKRLRSLS